MAVGYSLGNKDLDDEIEVLGELDPDVITYSKSLNTILTRECRNDCGYCGFQRPDDLVVPYSTIKEAKEARLNGARSVLYMAGV